MEVGYTAHQGLMTHKGLDTGNLYAQGGIINVSCLPLGWGGVGTGEGAEKGSQCAFCVGTVCSLL